MVDGFSFVSAGLGAVGTLNASSSSFGTACFGFVQSVCGGDPDKLGEFVTRFSRPVFPGETLRLELFDEGDVWRFRARVIERDLVVLDRGLARLR